MTLHTFWDARPRAGRDVESERGAAKALFEQRFKQPAPEPLIVTDVHGVCYRFTVVVVEDDNH